MAYKFQLGAAVLSGSLTQEGQILAKDSALSGSSLSLDGVAVTSTAAELNFLDGFADAAYDEGADSVVFFDATDNKLKRDAANDFSTRLADVGLLSNAGRLSVDIGGLTPLDSATVAQADEFMFDDNGTVKKITFSNLEDSIFGNVSSDATVAAGGALTLAATQSNVTAIYNTALKLGRSAGDDNIDFGTDDSIIFNIDGAEKFRIGSGSVVSAVATTFEDNVTIEGNLTVTGTTVEVDAAFIVTSSIQFEGSTPDGNEIELTTADPTGDRTITLPDLTGHVPLIAGAISNANVTAAEFLLLDGGSSVDTATVADGDAVLFNDAGTMKQLNVTSLKTYFQTGVTADTANSLRLNGADTVVASDITASNDVIMVDTSAARSIEMPDITSGDVGQLYMIKDIVGNAATNNITIKQSDSNHDIDGNTSILLESDNGAVMLLACSSSNGFFYSIF